MDIRSPAGVMSPDKVQTSLTGDKLAKIIADIDDLERQYTDTIQDLIDKIQKIARKIESMDNEQYRQILYNRYIESEAWEKIAVEMNYSFRHVLRLHGEALKAYEKMSYNVI